MGSGRGVGGVPTQQQQQQQQQHWRRRRWWRRRGLVVGGPWLSGTVDVRWGGEAARRGVRGARARELELERGEGSRAM